MTNRIYLTTLLSLLFVFGLQAQQDTCSIPITPDPPVQGNIYCPGDIVKLLTEAGYDSYSWYYNFTNSNQGGTLLTTSEDPQISFNISDIGFAYFYVLAESADCIGQSEPVVVDSWVFLLPVIQSSGQSEYCLGDSSLILYPSGGAASYQWFRNGDPIPGATGQEYWVKESGTYTLTVSYLECPDFYQSSGVGPTFEFIEPIVPMLLLDQNGLSVSSGTVLQWYLDGEPIPGATDPVLVPEFPGGTYMAQVEDANGCIVFSEEKSVAFTDDTEDKSIQATRVSPNPGDGFFLIESQELIKSIVVYNLTGQIILEQEVSASEKVEIDLRSAPAGQYWMLVKSQDDYLLIPIQKL
ncbi:MAG: T9SS type A sorting domain-containing protein [Bacteroidetes bacterium]|nr:T9SS type A sorting domain-containing protein [Bacteroidota bacterium]